MKRITVRSFCLVIVSMFLTSLAIGQANNYEGGTISWSEDLSNNSVEFTVKHSYTWSTNSSPAIGSSINGGTFYFGDGSSTTLSLQVAEIDTANNRFIAKASLSHSYLTLGQHTAYFETCCRFGSLQNNSGSDVRNETLVTIGKGNNSPAFSGDFRIKVKEKSGEVALVIPGADEDWDGISFRLARSSELVPQGNFKDPARVSVNSSARRLIFDTRGKPAGTLWSLGVVAEDSFSSVVYDFIVEVVPSNPGSNCKVTFNPLKQETCKGGKISLSANGVTWPCVMDWTGPNNFKKRGWDLANLKTGTYYYTLKDAAGCQVSDSLVLNPPIDVSPPVISAYDTVEVPVGQFGQSELDPYDLLNSYSDDCGIAEFKLSTESISCTDVGKSWKVTITAYDYGGNSATATTRIQVVDIHIPVVEFYKNVSVQLDEDGIGFLSGGMIDSQSFDNCGGITYSINQRKFDCDDMPEATVTFSVVDANGNGPRDSYTKQLIGNNVRYIKNDQPDTFTKTIAIDDCLPPVATCKDLTFKLDETGVVDVDPQMANDGSFDNCGVWYYTLDDSTFTCENLGANYLNLNVYDQAGNMACCPVTVTILDTIKPDIVCKDQEIFMDEDGLPLLDLNKVTEGSSDLCGIDSIYSEISGYTCADVKNRIDTVTVYVMDASGNTAQCSIQVGVQDTVSPKVYNFPSDTVIYTDSSICKVQYFWQEPVAADNCSRIVSVTKTHSSGDEFEVGIDTVTYVFIDSFSNYHVRFFTVTVVQDDFEAEVEKTTYASGYNLKCFSDEDAWAKVRVRGGCAPYTYNWSNGTSGTDSITGLGAGSYCVTVKDANGKEIELCFDITAPDEVVVNTTLVSGILCYNDNNAVVSASASGGTGTLVYSWSNGINAQTINGLSVGSYTVYVQDSEGCKDSSTIVITQPDSLGLVTVGIDATCATSEDGSIDLSVNGGTAPYTYSWSNGDTTRSIGQLAKGGYKVLVTDNNGCQAIDSVFINAPDTLKITGSTNGISCAGCEDDNSCDGSVTASVSGGVPPYSYSWSNGATSSDLTGLEPGTYVLTVTDANNCQVRENFFVSSPDILGAGFATIEQVCLDAADTCAWVAAENAGHAVWLNDIPGMASRQYTFINNSGNLNEFANGALHLTGTVANSADTSYKWELDVWFKNKRDWEEWSALGRSWKGSATNVGNLYKLWSYYEMDEQYNNRLIGKGSFTGKELTLTTRPTNQNYGFQVGDAANDKNTNYGASGWFYFDGSYSGIGDFNLDRDCTEPNAEADSINYNVDCDCNGRMQNFSFKYMGSGTVTVYAYDRNKGTIIGTYKNMTYGSEATVQGFDRHGRLESQTYLRIAGTSTYHNVHTSCSENIMGNYYGDLLITGYTDGDGVTCEGVSGTNGGNDNVVVDENCDCNGRMQAFTFQYTGSGPATIYAYNKNQSILIATYSNVHKGQIITVNGFDAQGRLEAHTYLVINGVSYNIHTSCSIDIKGQQYGPFYITGYVDGNGAQCETSPLLDNICTAVASVNPKGGTAPYSVNWSTGATGTTIENLCPGTYYATITDVNGCTYLDSVEVKEPVDLTINFNSNAPYCNTKGSISATVSGGEAPYTFEWNTGDTSRVIEGLEDGNYTLTVTDAAGCSVSGSVELLANKKLFVSANVTDVSCNGKQDGSIDLDISTSSAVSSISWSNGATTEDLNGLSTGTYIVTIQNNDGCSLTDTFEIMQPAPLSATISAKVYNNGYNLSANGSSDGEIVVDAQGGALSYFYSWTGPVNSARTIKRRVAHSYDDAEESTSGTVSLTSSDLELVYDKTDQVVGLRFTNINLPQGAQINNAYIQFTAEDHGSGSTNLRIEAELTDSSVRFSGNNENISGRSRSYTSVNWSASNWYRNDSSAAQRTPDLKALVNELTSRSGWKAGNAMSFIISGSGLREAFSYDGSAGRAPQLVINYSNGYNGDSLSGLAAGTYEVRVSDPNGCWVDRTITLVEPSGPAVAGSQLGESRTVRADQENFGSIQISPNPIRDHGTVNIENPGEGQLQIAIYDMAGNELFTQAENVPENLTGSLNVHFNTAGMRSGIYQLRITNSKGIREIRQILIAR